MEDAVRKWLVEKNVASKSASDIAKKISKSYTLYGCMLLLPPTVLSDELWSTIDHSPGEDDLDGLYALLAGTLHVTHIAINKPIPLLAKHSQDENVLRAPINFTPVHGDFGPATCDDPPTKADFDAAFWVTAKQNGISQTWAPRWTMFSRGNISEKARILEMDSVREAVEQGRADGRGCSTVDLFAGIGYFAFSYAKAGIGKVLCWDLNPWSIEGLRRGAAANKWKAIVHGTGATTSEQNLDDDAQFLVFKENNVLATERITSLRHSIPPIRHINCGMLPSSRDSLGIAAAIIDTELGGWIHIHENFAESEITAKAEETRAEFEQVLKTHRHREVSVKIEHINKLKSYAPRVIHCVIDLHVAPDYLP